VARRRNLGATRESDLAEETPLMKLGLIHYNAPGETLEEFFRFAADAGFGYVELQSRDVWPEGSDNPEAEAEKVKRLADGLGLKISALAAQNDFVVLDPEEVKRQVARMRRICGLAKLLGCDVIRTEGGSPKPEVPEDRWVEAIAGCITQCREFIETMGILLAVDNHGYVTNDHEVQLEVFRRVKSPNVGANLDTMNYRWFGHSLDTLRDIYARIAPHTFHTHLKDGTGSRESYVGAALGQGEIDLVWAVECLKQAGYASVWCAEWEGRGDKGAGYIACLDWMRQHI
jgi:sugar phosphate isomerase/epimerase